MTATHAALLAAHGITDPPAIFEGNKGFEETIAGRSKSTGLPRIWST
jgi:2-methylcitrate dehydratase